MAIVNKENRFTGYVSCLNLGDKIVLKPLKAMEVACPSVLRKSDPIIIKVIELIIDEQVGNIRYLWVNLKPRLFILFLAFKDNSWGNGPSICGDTFHSSDKLEIGTTELISWTLVTGNKEFLSRSPATTSTLDTLLIHVVDILRGNIMLFDDCLKEVKVTHNCWTV